MEQVAGSVAQYFKTFTICMGLLGILHKMDAKTLDILKGRKERKRC